ncbi:MAG: hypothetical protein BIFFINMI_02443 [Phycisphaerae bacterium]|nr:hypothetical protein [Phycisphaerae bacterium]
MTAGGITRGRRFPRRRSGQVLVIALLALFLLAGMVFYVYNLGDQVNRKVLMQNASDSAAMSGATWMARSMNVVAMNNVAQTRLIGLVAVLDSLPLATQMAYEEITEWVRGLDAQLAAGVPDQWLRSGLTSMTDRFHTEQSKLQPLYNALITSGYDVTEATFYRRSGAGGPPPHGSLWVAAKALEDFNTATVQQAGYLAQMNATRMGEVSGRDENLYNAGYPTTSFILPVLPELPAVLGTFMDFQKPVMEGRPPEYYTGGLGDHIRRGPYDQLYEWRYPRYDQSQTISWPIGTVQGTAGPVRGGPGFNLGGKQVGSSVVGGPQDHTIYASRTVHGPQTGWSTYGVYTWMVTNQIHDSGIAEWVGDNLRDTNWMRYFQQISKAKTDYIWGNKTIQSIHNPHWISVYPEAKEVAEKHMITVAGVNGQPPTQQSATVKYTMFYMVQTKSSIDPDAASFRSPGTFITNSDDPKAIWLTGWVDPATWESNPSMNARMISNYIWQVDWTYQTTFDETIGLPRSGGYIIQPDGTQVPVWHTVYIREQYVFGGIDIGDNIQIRDPANYTGTDDLPKPYLLDLTKADYRTTGERDYMSYLGISRISNVSRFWNSQFDSGQASDSVLALSEAHVFNNKSWDLWTQYWQARLRPINDTFENREFKYWVDARLNPNAGDLQAVSQLVDPNLFGKIRTILQDYDEEMAQTLIKH